MSSEPTREPRLGPWPFYDSIQQTIASNVLASGKVNAWTSHHVSDFEDAFSRYTSCKYSIATANGTVALSLAFHALGLDNSDEFITTPRTFIATVSAGVLCGAKPIFADVDPDSGCIDPNCIPSLISPRTKAIVVVHLGGWPADMDKIVSIARSYNLKIIEDCSQAHGAYYRGKPVGSIGDIATWSFCQDKIMSTAGEGGMVSTSSFDYWESMWSFKDHGKSNSALNNSDSIGGFKWLHHSFGTNYRLTSLQAAIGCYQLTCLPEWNSIRHRHAKYLFDRLRDLSILRIPMPPIDVVHAWYKFYVYLRPGLLKNDWSRERIIYEITQKGFPIFSGSCSEVYLEKCFVSSGLAPIKRLPSARMLGETSLMLLVHPTISYPQITCYADVVRSVIQSATA